MPIPVQNTAPDARGLLIGGKDVPAASGRTTDDLNPRTGEVFLRVPAADAADAARAVEAAHAAFDGWAATPASTRRALLERAADLLEQRAEEFTDIVISETVGTRTWAAFNIRMSAELIRQAAGLATRPTGSVLASDAPGEWSPAVREPAGVVAAFVPWNGPLILCARAVAVALATGNPVVIRPSEDAPVTSGYFLDDILAEAGVPDGVVNVVTNDRADAPEVVAALIADERVRRVNFTGSTPVARIVGRLAGEQLKPVILELGGKNPILVLDDADPDYAASGVTVAKFMNSGQIGMCVDRVIVQRGIADAFVTAFLAKVAALGQDDPTQPHTLVGPLVSARAADRVAALVADAVAKGAKVLAGGSTLTAGHPFGAARLPRRPPPDADAGMRRVTTRLFSPVRAPASTSRGPDASKERVVWAGRPGRRGACPARRAG